MLIFKEKELEVVCMQPWHSGNYGDLIGHTYKLQVGFESKDKIHHTVVDFTNIDQILTDIMNRYHHSDLNIHMYNPTADRFIIKIFNDIKNHYSFPNDLVNVIIVRLWETPTNYIETKFKKNEENLWREI